MHNLYQSVTCIVGNKKYSCVSIKCEMCYNKFVMNNKLMKYKYLIHSFKN